MNASSDSLESQLQVPQVSSLLLFISKINFYLNIITLLFVEQGLEIKFIFTYVHLTYGETFTTDFVTELQLQKCFKILNKYSLVIFY